MLAKVKQAKEIINQYRRVIVAFSGGVDSLLLLKLAVDVLGKENILAVTVKSPLSTKGEAENAKELSEFFGVEHLIVELDELANRAIADNPVDRCYHCKKFRYQQLLNLKYEKGSNVVLDGTNYSDLGDYRPGMKACEELGIISPLKEAGITKSDVRILLKEAEIKQWDTPSRACLASRIPYNDKITIEKLQKIDEAEQFLMSLGILNLRVRLHNNLARIEIPKENFEMLLKDNIYDKIVKHFKKIGFKFITLDLEGVRSGSLNP